MSRISFIALKLKINNRQTLNQFESEFQTLNVNLNAPESVDEYKLIFQIRNYNVLRLIGGIGATAYTYQN